MSHQPAWPRLLDVGYTKIWPCMFQAPGVSASCLSLANPWQRCSVHAFHIPKLVTRKNLKIFKLWFGKCPLVSTWINMSQPGGCIALLEHTLWNPRKMSDPQLCQEEGHVVLQVEATKTRWECASCKFSEDIRTVLQNIFANFPDHGWGKSLNWPQNPKSSIHW